MPEADLPEQSTEPSPRVVQGTRRGKGTHKEVWGCRHQGKHRFSMRGGPENSTGGDTTTACYHMGHADQLA